jgi:hypothetical protein
MSARTYGTFNEMLDGEVARVVAASVASILTGFRAGHFDGEVRDALIAATLRGAEGERERLRQRVIASHHANSRGVPDDWGASPGEPCNDLTSIEVRDGPVLRRESGRLTSDTEVMGIA